MQTASSTEPVFPLLKRTLDPVIASFPYVPILDGQVALCQHSGIAYQISPRVYDYGKGYFANYVDRAGTEVANQLNRVRMATVYGILGDRMDPNPEGPTSLIDVGIGSGEFLQWMMDRKGVAHSMACYGYDINPEGVNWLWNRMIFLDPYEMGRISGSSLVTLWDTLEHIPEPQSFFALFEPGAWLACSLPVFAAPLTEAVLLASKHYKPDEHLYYFTRGGLIHWLDRHGFDFIRYHDGETTAGREGIGTFVFRKRAQPKCAECGGKGVIAPTKEICPRCGGGE